MLREIKTDSNPERRWFQDSEMDLFLWSTATGEPTRFELTYDKSRNEKSLVWAPPSHFEHCALDDGSGNGHHPSTPIHRADIPFDAEYLLNMFSRNSVSIDPDVTALVKCKIKEYGRTLISVEEPVPTTPGSGWLLLSLATVLVIAAVVICSAK